MSAALSFTARLPGDEWDVGTLGRQAGGVKGGPVLIQSG